MLLSMVGVNPNAQNTYFVSSTTQEIYFLHLQISIGCIGYKKHICELVIPTWQFAYFFTQYEQTPT